MSDLSKLILFVAATIGLTNIIVDPAAIMQPIRDFIDTKCHPWLAKLVSCYQCTGTWVGFLCGFFLISTDPAIVFLCGMAGSYLATMSATITNYLEARSIIGVDDNA